MEGLWKKVWDAQDVWGEWVCGGDGKNDIRKDAYFGVNAFETYIIHHLVQLTSMM